MTKKFKRKFPVYQIVATYKEPPQIPYKYVTQLTIRELVNFILTSKGRLSHSEIQAIVAWLRSSPYIYNSGLKPFKWF